MHLKGYLILINNNITNIILIILRGLQRVQMWGWAGFMGIAGLHYNSPAFKLCSSPNLQMGNLACFSFSSIFHQFAGQLKLETGCFGMIGNFLRMDGGQCQPCSEFSNFTNQIKSSPNYDWNLHFSWKHWVEFLSWFERVPVGVEMAHCHYT